MLQLQFFFSRPIRGMTAVVAGAGPAHACYFAAYEYTKEKMTKLSPEHNQINYSTFLKKVTYFPVGLFIKICIFCLCSYISSDGHIDT